MRLKFGDFKACFRKVLCALLILLGLSHEKLYAQPNVYPVRYTGEESEIVGKRNVEIFIDSFHSFSPASDPSGVTFKTLESDIISLGTTPYPVWVHFIVNNVSDRKRFFIEVDNALLDAVTLVVNDSGRLKADSVTHNLPFHARSTPNVNAVFEVMSAGSGKKDVYVKVESNSQILVPIYIRSAKFYTDSGNVGTIFFAMYFGIMLSMFLYNLFLYVNIKESLYLYYALYIVSVTLVQFDLKGFGFKYLYPNNVWLQHHATAFYASATAFTSIAFMRQFVRTRLFTPKLDKGFILFITAYSLVVLMSLAGFERHAYNLINVNGLLLALFMIGTAAIVRFKFSFRPAGFFLVAWTLFLAGVIVFVLKDVGVLPYNAFTTSVLQIGSAVETILLSIALADRINILKKEKEASQARALAAAQENERIIREQNTLLERKVEERTYALQETNGKLELALSDLKETQSQMVEQEKMASLGQLTAGIAHEINNPINFVTSNIKPLRRDFNDMVGLFQKVEQIGTADSPTPERRAAIERAKEEVEFDYLKEEVDILLQGIYEGSTRTAEIVKGLRVFSRLDESDLKRASIEDGLDSTCLIINNLLNNKIEIVKDYAAIPPIECYAGKINQVFLNLMTNAIHAVRARFGDNHGGKLVLKTEMTGDRQVAVSISDNGTGMPPEVKQKIFEPFFTTKDVGEGTGLGLSITWKTIVKHNGHVNVDSVVGEGTTFTLILPINQPSEEEIEHSSNVAVTSHE